MAAQACLKHYRRRIDRAHWSGVGSGSNDFVDPIQDCVVEDDFGAGEQIVQVLHRAWADDRRGHARVSRHKVIAKEGGVANPAKS